MSRQRIEPQRGCAFVLSRGQVLRVIDPTGEQVADFVAFARDDPREWLSSGRTFDYNNTIYLTTGHVLYSNRSRAFLTITADTVGRHDVLYTPCSQATFDILYKVHGHHPSCLENLATNLQPFGLQPDHIPTTFNIFMNVEVAGDGSLSILPPRSKAGDYLELRAETDLVVGLTACSAEMSNNYTLKPIEFELRPGSGASAATTERAQMSEHKPRRDEQGWKPDENEEVVPLPSSDTQSDHDRVRQSNDRDQRLEREGKPAPHNRGYDEAADGPASPGVRHVVDEP
jgi:uncharacterized protein YcgI (DUF1989 family)